MFRGFSVKANDVITPLNSILDRFAAHLRNNAVRAGVVAASKPIATTFAGIIKSNTKPGKEPPMRTLRGTDIKISRPHLRDSIATKIWRSRNGNTLVAYIGPISVEVPHAHWFEIGPKERYTKDGRYRGSMPDYMVLSKTWASSEQQALSQFEATVKEKLNSFQG